MTAEFISKQCGEITVRVNNANIPTPMFLSALRPARQYTHNKTSTGRALMMPDEVRRLPKDQAILLIRGAKPLLLQKITPEEHPSFCNLKYCKAIEHIPEWKKQQQPAAAEKIPTYQMRFDTDFDNEDSEPPVNLKNGIDCSTLKEIDTKDI